MIEITRRMIELGRLDPKPFLSMTLKLAEETGELCEAVNHHAGHLPNKVMKEPLAGEVADVINCAIAVLIKAYPQLSDEDIYALLEKSLVQKADKWERVIKGAT